MQAAKRKQVNGTLPKFNPGREGKRTMRDPVSRIENTHKSTTAKDTQLQEGPRALNRRTQTANQHMRRYATSLVVREMEVRTMMKHHFTPIRRIYMKNKIGQE